MTFISSKNRYPNGQGGKGWPNGRPRPYCPNCARYPKMLALGIVQFSVFKSDFYAQYLEMMVVPPITDLALQILLKFRFQGWWWIAAPDN